MSQSIFEKILNLKRLSKMSIFTVLLTFATGVSARDFEYTYEGQTITYTVIDESALTVMTKAGSWRDHTVGNSVSGDLILPSNPIDDNTKYTLIEISECAFDGCSELTSVVIPNTITSIGNCSFRGCSGLTSIIIPNSVTLIDTNAFSDCTGLTSLIIPDSVTKIGKWTFFGCSNLTSVIFGNTVAEIGAYSFGYCTGLISVTIPSSVSDLGYRVFYDCPNISSVTYFAKQPITSGSEIFLNDVYENATLYVHAGATAAMRETTPWNLFSKIEEIYKYVVNYDVNEGYVLYNGHVIQSPFNPIFDQETDADLSLMIIPRAGFGIESIEQNGTNIFSTKTPDNVYEITYTNAIGSNEIDIRFREIGEATLTISSSGHHTVTHTYPEGSDITIALEPQQGWRLISATLNDAPIEFSTDNKVTISAIRGYNNLNAIYVEESEE